MIASKVRPSRARGRALRGLMLALVAVQLPNLGCDGEGGLDCVGDPDFYRYVTLDAESLPEGRVGIPYEGALQAEVQNEPSDDYYDYDFDIRSERLPPGLIADREGRRLILSGTPTEAGTFTFDVEVDVSSPEVPEPPCLTLSPVSEEFTIVINALGTED